MLFKTFASVLSIAVPIFATSPDDIAVLATLPSYGVSGFTSPAFDLDTVVRILGAPEEDGDTGRAHFAIKVHVKTDKKSFVVEKVCPDEEFVLEQSGLVFDPFPLEAETCTREFVAEMNRGFGLVVVSSIRLVLAESGSKLVFIFQGSEIPLSRI